MRDIIKSLAVGAAAGLALFLVMWVITTFAIVKIIGVGVLGIALLLVATWGAGEIIRDLVK